LFQSELEKYAWDSKQCNSSNQDNGSTTLLPHAASASASSSVSSSSTSEGTHISNHDHVNTASHASRSHADPEASVPYSVDLRSLPPPFGHLRPVSSFPPVPNISISMHVATIAEKYAFSVAGTEHQQHDHKSDFVDISNLKNANLNDTNNIINKASTRSNLNQTNGHLRIAGSIGAKEVIAIKDMHVATCRHLILQMWSRSNVHIMKDNLNQAMFMNMASQTTPLKFPNPNLNPRQHTSTPFFAVNPYSMRSKHSSSLSFQSTNADQDNVNGYGFYPHDDNTTSTGHISTDLIASGVLVTDSFLCALIKQVNYMSQQVQVLPLLLDIKESLISELNKYKMDKDFAGMCFQFFEFQIEFELCITFMLCYVILFYYFYYYWYY
jgi:hypothetical protein